MLACCVCLKVLPPSPQPAQHVCSSCNSAAYCSEDCKSKDDGKDKHKCAAPICAWSKCGWPDPQIACLRCGVTWYTNRECLDLHWPKHRADCIAPASHWCSVGECRVDTAALRCSRCHVARYCSPQHQRVDWQTHKHRCAALRVRHLMTSALPATSRDAAVTLAVCRRDGQPYPSSLLPPEDELLPLVQQGIVQRDTPSGDVTMTPETQRGVLDSGWRFTDREEARAMLWCRDTAKQSPPDDAWFRTVISIVRHGSVDGTAEILDLAINAVLRAKKASKGDPERVADAASHFLALSRLLRERKDGFQAVMYEADALRSLGRRAAAEAVLVDLLDRLPHGSVEQMRALVMLSFDRDSSSAALKTAQRASTLAMRLGEQVGDGERVFVLQRLGQAALEADQAEQALVAFQQVKEIAAKGRADPNDPMEPETLADAYRDVATALQKAGMLQQAEEEYDRALAHYDALQQPKELLRTGTLLNKATMLLQMDRMDEAVVLLHQCQDVLNKPEHQGNTLSEHVAKVLADVQQVMSSSKQ